MINAQDIWEQPIIIGASVSDGYEHTEKLGGPKSNALALDHFLLKRINTPDIKFKNYSNRFTFISPVIISSRQVARAIKAKPSIVIAVDYLFWHLYGKFNSEEQRLKAFESALAKLDPVTSALVIGNIPDASHSINKMLGASQVPALKTIEQANITLNAWADKRPQTTVINLKSFMAKSVSNKALKLSLIEYPVGTTKNFLQSDMLHLTPSGVTALSYAVLEAVQRVSTLKDSQLNLPAKVQ